MTPADMQYQDEIMCSCDLDLDPSITALQTDRQTAKQTENITTPHWWVAPSS